MAELASIDKLVGEIQTKIRDEVAEGIRPLIKQLADTLAQLERVVGGGSARAAAPARGPAGPAAKAVGGRRGRPPKGASAAKAPAAKGRPGRPRKEAGAAPAAAPARRGKSAGGKLPRGSLNVTLKDLLAKAGGAMKLQAITKAVMAMPDYRRRPEKSVYTQIIQGIKRIPEIQKNEDGEYAIKGGKG